MGKPWPSRPGGGAADPRVHLVTRLAGVGVHGKLHVGAARLHADVSMTMPPCPEAQEFRGCHVCAGGHVMLSRCVRPWGRRSRWSRRPRNCPPGHASPPARIPSSRAPTARPTLSRPVIPPGRGSRPGQIAASYGRPRRGAQRERRRMRHGKPTLRRWRCLRHRVRQAEAAAMPAATTASRNLSRSSQVDGPTPAPISFTPYSPECRAGQVHGQVSARFARHCGQERVGRSAAMIFSDQGGVSGRHKWHRRGRVRS